MLDFNSVQQRGMGRAMLMAQGGEPPPHVYVVDPLVQQLSGEDYCAGNGALLTPSEAQGMAGLLHQMGHAMDHLEARRDEATGAAQASMEAVEVLAAKVGRYQRIHRWAMIGAVAIGLYVLQIAIVLALR
jgi:hypothetical protein